MHPHWRVHPHYCSQVGTRCLMANDATEIVTETINICKQILKCKATVQQKLLHYQAYLRWMLPHIEHPMWQVFHCFHLAVQHGRQVNRQLTFINFMDDGKYIPTGFWVDGNLHTNQPIKFAYKSAAWKSFWARYGAMLLLCVWLCNNTLLHCENVDIFAM